MTTFVLVHGAWHGSWCWQRIRKALQAQGHEVFTPTLTGVGERSHQLAPGVNLETHIEDVLNTIRWEELADFVLCGHSYGGAVVSGVADRVTDRVRALVYLDAFLLDDGQSMHDTLPPEHRELQVELARAHGEGWKVPPIPAEVFAVNERDRDWMNRQCTMQSLATFQQPLRLTGTGVAPARTTYILASGWTGSPLPASMARARARGYHTRSIACGHDVMLDRPEELTTILLEFA